MNAISFSARPCLALLAALLFASCTQSNFDRIPRNGYITHFQPSDGSRMAFDSYWDISDNKDWDERVKGEKNKSQAIYIRPITLAYFDDMPDSPYQRRQIEALKDYFEETLFKALRSLDGQDNSFHLVSQPGANAYTVDIALLSAEPTQVGKNVLSAAAGYFVKGSGLLLSQKQDEGSISMGARFYSPHGRLVAEVADFEYGQKSVVGMALLDAKEFQQYAYHRQSIDQWVKQFVQIFTTVHEQKIRKPWFTLKPW